jgi:PhzF family phenazine biosynthesis protein
MSRTSREPDVLRYAAFTETPEGGNPAGVVLDAGGLSEPEMQAIAADVGYSETAFLIARGGDGDAAAGREYDVRYFSPEAEVPFCGHATIASGVALAERDGPGRLLFHIASGELVVETRTDERGHALATLTSVAPTAEAVSAADVDEALRALRWSAADLDPGLPPIIAYAGARHLILAARTRERLASLDYDYDRLRALMLRLELITVALVWREAPGVFHARNAGASIGVVEDPATGASAAALGGYLLSLGKVVAPASLTILQGFDMGRPSRLLVEVPSDAPGIRVTGSAVPLGAPTGS